ncbi:prolipoprotein diacylglyceryl transferase [Actibacterium atlanticum]|uniref:Phosphatidylglycerol--prolipoprotein diacylglyceryl transferase n=1 Tax=Actibacterium atlanticum TaxID=1461693 RepID=A0A058ZPA0_9RHOB|nr:prolipoprotein diacylglyceryl transferase [Actibacterium atlanticum]KCV82992.1 prolipoprotein diacylglyceryl transferase [Actibacterium atlanticum]
MQAIWSYPDISPEIFSISLFGFEFALRWYAMAYIVALIVGWRLVVRLMKTPRLWPGQTAPMTPEQVEELLTWVIFGVILGGRLGFVLFYKPMHYLQNPLEIPILWQGGMAFHGGLLGVMLALIWFCRKHGIILLSAADALAVATPLGLFFGRMANFINGELWGRATDVPWAMIFPTDPMGLPRHPSQLYEAALEGLVLMVVILWLVFGRHWLKRPGQITGVFFAGYGLARIFVELFRQADAQFVTPDNPAGWVIHSGGVGLSQGQLLSLPMVAFGVALIVIARRKA